MDILVVCRAPSRILAQHNSPAIGPDDMAEAHTGRAVSSLKAIPNVVGSVVTMELPVPLSVRTIVKDIVN